MDAAAPLVQREVRDGREGRGESEDHHGDVRFALHSAAVRDAEVARPARTQGYAAYLRRREEPPPRYGTRGAALRLVGRSGKDPPGFERALVQDDLEQAARDAE